MDKIVDTLCNLFKVVLHSWPGSYEAAIYNPGLFYLMILFQGCGI